MENEEQDGGGCEEDDEDIWDIAHFRDCGVFVNPEPSFAFVWSQSRGLFVKERPAAFVPGHSKASRHYRRSSDRQQQEQQAALLQIAHETRFPTRSAENFSGFTHSAPSRKCVMSQMSAHLTLAQKIAPSPPRETDKQTEWRGAASEFGLEIFLRVLST